MYAFTAYSARIAGNLVLRSPKEGSSSAEDEPSSVAFEDSLLDVGVAEEALVGFALGVFGVLQFLDEGLELLDLRFLIVELIQIALVGGGRGRHLLEVLRGPIA